MKRIHGWWLASYLFLWILVLVSLFVILATLRQLGLVFVRLGGSLGARQTSEGPEVGQSVPVTRVHDREGIVRSLVPTAEPFKLLLFLSTTCRVCEEMIPNIPAFARAVRTDAELLVILGEPDKRGKLGKWKSGRPPVIVDPSLGDSFDLPAMPYGIVIDREGKITSKGTVNDMLQLESLLNDSERTADGISQVMTTTAS